MRFFAMILLVLLLPLGSGSGEAMAAEPHHTITQAHQPGTHASAAHLSDCLGHGTTVDNASPGANDIKTADADCDPCSACSACQTCQAVGLAFSRADLQPLPASNARPQALSPAFASAPAARDQKPPIS
jgi:hypothetical protein